MKTTHLKRTHLLYSRVIGIAGCCLTSLFLASRLAAGVGFIASGPTFLNVYLTDGSSTVSPTVSPYNPSETIYNNTGIGTPLTSYGPSSWLQDFDYPAAYPYPGPVSANWGPSFFYNANVTAIVNYQQYTYFLGSNNVSSSSVTPGGTSLTFVNTGPGIGELRLDWVTQYTYDGPPAWQAGTFYNFGDMVSDANGNPQFCLQAGTSGSSAPSWMTGMAQITYDSGAQWICEWAYVPNFFLINFSGAVHNYSALVGQQTIQVGANPPGNEVLPWGGDFPNYASLPSGLSSDLDNWFSANGSVFGYDTVGLTFNVSPSGSTPYQRCYNGDAVDTWGYIDVFIDPGSGVATVRPSVPPELGVTMQGATPVVYIQTITGTNMALQMCTNLETANWMTFTNLSPTVVTANGASYLGFEITNAPSPAAFFRTKP